MASTRRRMRGSTPGQVQRTIAGVIASGETFSVGFLTLVRNRLVGAMSGARDVGTAIGMVGVAVTRGSIRAAYDIGGDLGLVTKGSMKGTLRQLSDETKGISEHLRRRTLAASAKGQVLTFRDYHLFMIFRCRADICCTTRFDDI